MAKRKAEFISTEDSQLPTLRCESDPHTAVTSCPNRHPKVEAEAIEADTRRVSDHGGPNQVRIDTGGTSGALPIGCHVALADESLPAHTLDASPSTVPAPATEYTAAQQETLAALEAFWSLLLEARYEPC